MMNLHRFYEYMRRLLDALDAYVPENTDFFDTAFVKWMEITDTNICISINQGIYTPKDGWSEVIWWGHSTKRINLSKTQEAHRSFSNMSINDFRHIMGDLLDQMAPENQPLNINDVLYVNIESLNITAILRNEYSEDLAFYKGDVTGYYNRGILGA